MSEGARNDQITRGRDDARVERAAARVARFVERFDPGYYELVCHAALPLVLTPELVSYLRNGFLPALPWIAEVDLLLSDLCAQVGYELYAMDADVRAYVLRVRSPSFDTGRMKAVAQLLISYVRYLAEHSSQMSDRQLASQQWAALVYVGSAERQQVVDEIVARFQACEVGGPQVGAELLNQAEMTQLAELTQTFREQLVDYPALLEYAALVSDVQLGCAMLDEARIAQQYEVGPSQLLQLPAEMRQGLRDRRRVQNLATPSTDLLADDLSTQGTEHNAHSAEKVPAEDTLETLSVADFPPLTDFEFNQVVFADEPVAEELIVDEPAASSFPPPLSTETFTIRTLERQETVRPERPEFEPPGFDEFEPSEFEPFEIVTATVVEADGQFLAIPATAQARRFTASLPENIALEMVAVPGGSFTMGSPKDEAGRYERESPQHDIVIAPFCMGRYPITQVQWRVVAAMPQIERSLEPSPSKFKGDKLPVEQVSWYDAVEFCSRLSAYTERQYYLPTEAEWEYACRAGTTTPFCFGAALTPALAHYRPSAPGQPYATGGKRKPPKATAAVDRTNMANGFGLSDAHGNVWEWCRDVWREQYSLSPQKTKSSSDSEDYRLARGGSWYSLPDKCRSASRFHFRPTNIYADVGFRIACAYP